MFAVSETRKNRKSHLSQRSGLTKTIASILSTIPLRLDWWIRSLWQSGQCFMSLLPVAGKAALTGRVYATNARVTVQNRTDVERYPKKRTEASNSTVVPLRLRKFWEFVDSVPEF
jgi:hypothetical protein